MLLYQEYYICIYTINMNEMNLNIQCFDLSRKMDGNGCTFSANKNFYLTKLKLNCLF